ncbi:MAG: flippase-like domain-containing protein [Deltaproteobacteria bacterium]|nr:flippase-like domain-containing protein [Deltaproteobacteria bacterium]
MSAEPEVPSLEGAARRGLGWALVFMVLALGVAAVVTTVGEQREAVGALLSRLSVPWLLAAAAVMSAGVVCLALRWRALFPPGVQADVAPLTTVLLVGTLLNYALPGPVGEFVGAAMAGRRFRFPAEAAFAAGVHARFIGLGLSGLGAIAMVSSGVVPLPEGADTWIELATVAIGGGAVVLATLSAFPARLAALSTATLGRVRLLRRLDASVHRFAEALALLRGAGPVPYLRAAGWALVGHGCVMGGVWIAGYAMGQAPLLPGLVFTYAASTAGAIVLFAFPGSQLGWDAMFASLLATSAGVDVATAVALALLVRLQQLALVSLGAIALTGWMRDESGARRG